MKHIINPNSRNFSEYKPNHLVISNSKIGSHLNCLLSMLKKNRTATKLSYLSAVLAFISVNPANAALSTTTVNSIKGDKPIFFATESIVNKLGFNYNGTDYNEISGNINSNTTKYFDHTTNLNDFVIKSYFVPRATIDDNKGDYFDTNNDAFDPKQSISNTLNYVWKDSNNVKIDPADFNNIACSHNKYKMPLKLEITATDIKVHTQFGDPNESDPVNFIETQTMGAQPITKTYQIAVANTCFAKPYSLISDPLTQWRSVKNDKSENDEKWNLTGIGINNIPKNKPNFAVGGGVTEDYVVNQGFKVAPTLSKKHFPTTGFAGAQFQLVMGGVQNDYTFTTNNSSVTVDKDGLITLNQPTKTVTITATLKSDDKIHYDYTFSLDLWLEPKSQSFQNQNDARAQCTGSSKLLSRKELNNSSEFTTKNLDGAKGRIYNVFTRGIGYGVFGEWGRSLNQQYNSLTVTYPKSNWKFGWYYTNESHNTTNDKNQAISEAILVSSHDGMISFPSAWGIDEAKRAVCGTYL